jgi:hypothetical protein
MTDRGLDFKVYLPQLEADPGRFKAGVRRFRDHKNADSPALVLGGGSFFSSSPSQDFQIPSKLRSPSLENSYNYPISRLLRVSPNPPVSKSRRPVKFLRSDPIHNEMLDLLSHPAFKQPTFTKQSPKLLLSNPITGYVPPTSLTPLPKHKLPSLLPKLS